MVDDKTNDLNTSKAALREKIIKMALEAFTRSGIKSIKMDDIANMLGISKRTLYEIFTDKEELLIAAMDYQHAEMMIFAQKVMEDSKNVLEIVLKFFEKSIELYHNTNKRFFEDMNKYPRLQEKMKENRENNSVKTVEFLKKGVDQGIFRDDINFEVMHILLREQMMLLMNTNLCDAYSFFEVYESIMFVFMRGISTQKGQEILDNYISKYKKQYQSK